MAATRVRLSVVDDRSADSLCGFVESAVMPGSRVVTDDWSAYGGLRARGFHHHAIAERGDPEVAEEFLPIVHLVFSNLKNALSAVHDGFEAMLLGFAKSCAAFVSTAMARIADCMQRDRIHHSYHRYSQKPIGKWKPPKPA